MGRRFQSPASCLSAVLGLLAFLCNSSAYGEPFITPEAINNYLMYKKVTPSPIATPSKGSKFKTSGLAFVINGLAYNVDPRLIVAIAGQESQFGTKWVNCMDTQLNAWSWFYQKPCKAAPLQSWEAGIRGVTKQIRTYFNDVSLKVTDIKSIGEQYCPIKDDPKGCPDWPGGVMSFYTDSFWASDKVGSVIGKPFDLFFHPERIFFSGVEGDVSDWTPNACWKQVTSPESIKVDPDIWKGDQAPSNLVTLGKIPKDIPSKTYQQGFLASGHTGNKAWYYGEKVKPKGLGTYIGSDFNPATQTPKNGGTSATKNEGDLITPVIDLKGYTRAFLVFFTW